MVAIADNKKTQESLSAFINGDGRPESLQSFENRFWKALSNPKHWEKQTPHELRGSD